MTATATPTTRITTLPRRFRLGKVTVLDDPDPSLPAEQAVKLYAHAYPYVNVATLGEPEVIDGTLVYPVDKPPATTKG